MGCCCAPMSARPDDPSVKLYAPVTQAIAHIRSNTPVYYSYGPGLAYVSEGLFVYKSRWQGRISFYLKDVQKISLERAFRGKGYYYLPCYCCPCTGCPDGIVDVRGTVDGVDVHVGFAMPNAEEFVERLQAQIGNLIQS